MTPSLITRVLLSLIRGSGSEFLRGDLEEWSREESVRRSRGDRPRSYGWEVARSVVHWWGPKAVAARRSRSERALWAGSELGREVRIALRGLMRRPGYAILVVAVMGVGIGATTTVLTIVDRVLVRTLPYPEAERLTVIGTTFPDREWRQDVSGLQHLAGFSLANFLEWEERGRSFERIAGIERRSVLLPDEGAGPEILQTSAVTPSFFDILPVRPAAGRVFLPHEYSMAASDVVMLSYATWVSRYGSDPAVIGSTLGSVGGTTEIVGVLPAEFDVPEAVARDVTPLWFPIKLDSERYADRGGRGLRGIGLLRSGVSVEAARAEFAAIAADLANEFPDGNVYPDGRRLGAGVNALQSHTVGASREPIVLFMGAAMLLLLISGLNAANLILVRGLAREREIDVRLALGAGQGRLIRMFLVEALLLAIAGGAIGLALAQAGVAAFRTLGPSSIPRMAEIGVDGRIALMAAAVTLGCGVLTGLIPALRLSERTSRGQLGGSGKRTTARKSAWPWTVGAQLALSVLLMVSAGLLMESFVGLRSFGAGFDSSSALTFQQALKRPGTEDQPVHQLWDEVLDQVETLPGYTRVAAASNLPYQSPNWAPWVVLPDDEPDSYRTGIAGFVISHDYFEVLSIPLIQGRAFDSSDGPDNSSVVLVNEAFVSAHMPGADPLGTTIRFRQGDEHKELRVVGVVGNTVQVRPEEGLRPAVYVPYTQSDWPSIWVFARSTGDPLSGVNVLRQRIAEVNPYVPPQRISSMTDRIGASRTGPRFNATLAMAFGLVSLLLSAGGLYGALSFGVGRRLKEIGVRITLGASRFSVLALVLRQGLRVTLAGMTVGIAAALLSGRLISAFLFDVEPTSPRTFGAVTACLLVVAAVASLGPALRATRVDPMRSLNAE